MPPKTASARTAHWLWPLLLLLGCVTAVIAWLLVAMTRGDQAGWMALLCAAEVAWMLRLGNLQGGRLRVLVAVVATALVVVAANWAIAAAHIGVAMGLDPWTSSLKLGAGLAWTLLSLANSTWDWLCYVLALGLAAWISR
ncbi:MAG TPA: hypothetical protein VGC74_09115 [Stenotrophomonas sp.]|jgi:hypothetical protein